MKTLKTESGVVRAEDVHSVLLLLQRNLKPSTNPLRIQLHVLTHTAIYLIYCGSRLKIIESYLKDFSPWLLAALIADTILQVIRILHVDKRHSYAAVEDWRQGHFSLNEVKTDVLELKNNTFKICLIDSVADIGLEYFSLTFFRQNFRQMSSEPSMEPAMVTVIRIRAKTFMLPKASFAFD